MTRLDIQQRQRNYFNNDIYYTGIDFNDSIQDGLDEIVAFSGCIFKSASLPFVNNLSYYDMISLLPDYIGAIAIFNTVVKRWLIPTSEKKLVQDRYDWEISDGTPFYFVPISHRYIAIYKKPIVNNYGNFYIYYRAASPIVGDTDIISIPDDHMTVLEHYVRTDLLEQQQEFKKGSSVFVDYAQQLELFRAFVQSRRIPGRVPSLK